MRTQLACPTLKKDHIFKPITKESHLLDEKQNVIPLHLLNIRSIDLDTSVILNRLIIIVPLYFHQFHFYIKPPTLPASAPPQVSSFHPS